MTSYSLAMSCPSKKNKQKVALESENVLRPSADKNKQDQPPKKVKLRSTTGWSWRSIQSQVPSKYFLHRYVYKQTYK